MRPSRDCITTLYTRVYINVYLVCFVSFIAGTVYERAALFTLNDTRLTLKRMVVKKLKNKINKYVLTDGVTRFTRLTVVRT